MIKKKAWIRSDKEVLSRRCPFGLPITEACQYAGASVTHMCPLEAVSDRQREQVEKANQRVYIYHKDGNRCIYAANVIEKLKAVNCDFGDTAQGMHAPAISGSPLYAQTFSGIGLDGLYAFPLGFYADNNESRNLFTGLFSLVGEEEIDLIKIAKQSGCPCMLKRLEKGDEISPEERQEMEEVLDQCRYDFEQQRTDTAKVKELADKYNPRKKL